MWTVVFGFKGSLGTIIGLKNRRADLAEYLIFYFAVVVVQVNVRCVTGGALFGLWDGVAPTKLDGFKWPTMLGLMGFDDCLEV